MRLDHWLAQATADADSRGLPDLRGLLEALGRATVVLRSAPWNPDPSGRRTTPPPQTRA